MATTEGIEYFPINVGFFDDDKILLIESEFGAKGSVIAMRLLCKIYSNGYYYQWGDDACQIFARKSGADLAPNLVKEVVNGLIRRSFFDKGMFDTFGILTSRSIQQRYFEAVKRRQKVEVNRDYLLVDISKYSNIATPLNPANPPAASPANPAATTANPATSPAATPANPPASSPPTSVGASRFSREEETTVPPASAAGEKDAIAAEVQKLTQSQFWLENVAMRFHLTIDQIKEYLEAFAIDCRSRGTDSHENIQDAQRHFNDWLRIQLKNPDNTDNNGTGRRHKAGADERRPAKGVAAKTEDFSTTF